VIAFTLAVDSLVDRGGSEHALGCLNGRVVVDEPADAG
jgi:hypothetical protein